MGFLLILTIAIGVASLTMAVLCLVNRDKLIIANRLKNETLRPGAVTYVPPQLEESFVKRVGALTFGNLSGFIRKIVPVNRREVYRQRLQRAGNPMNMDLDSFLLFKYTTLVMAIVIGLATRSPLMFAFCTIIGILLPDLFLKSQEDRRRDEILRSFPDILDLLTVSVQAGLGFDAALQKVVEKSKGPLVDEFDQTMKEVSMGKPRRQALRDMADRMDVNDVTTFLSSIIQADQLGISISNILRIQSNQVRETRRMKTEEKAQKAPIKMLIPLVVFIFPVILIVLLGPAIIQIVDSLSRT